MSVSSDHLQPRTDGRPRTTGQIGVRSYPLAPIQAGLAVESVLVTRSANLEQYVCRFDAEVVDLERMNRAWAVVQRRHESLRSTIHLDDPTGPCQRVHDTVVGLQVVDQSAVGRADHERVLDEWLDRDRTAGLDLSTVPSMRLCLLVFERRCSVLVWTFHHALLDGRSSARVLEEALDLYDAGVDEVEAAWIHEPEFHEPEFHEPGIHEPGFHEHVEAVLTQDLAAARSFFCERFGNWGGPSPAPAAAGDTPVGGGRHEEVELRMTGAWLERAVDRSRRLDVTVGSILLASWALLMSRWNDSDDVVFGTTRSGRHTVPGADRMVGCLINTLPLRLKLDPTWTVEDLLRDIRDFQVAVRPHEHASLRDIADWVGVGADQRLLSTAVVYESDLLDSRLRARGGRWEHRRIELLEQSSFPLMLSAHQDDGLRLRLEYDTDEYDRETATRLVANLGHLLEAVVDTAPTANLEEITMLSDAESSDLLVGRNPPPWTPVEGSYIDRFEATVAGAAAAVAVEDSGGESITYAELDERANRLAHLLLRRGATGSEPVALCLSRSIDFVVAMLAARKAQAPYLPLDPDYPAEALTHRLRDSGAQLVVATSESSRSLDATGVSVLRIDCLAEDLADQPPSAPMRTPAGPDSVAYVIYTSGTTGLPKGVMISDGSLVDLCVAVTERYELGAGDRVLQFCSLSFDVSVEEIAPTLLAGGTVVLRSPETSSSMGALVDASATRRLTVLNLPSAIWHTLVTHLERTGARLSRSVRLVVVGGEKVSRHAYESWSTIHPEIRWLNGYGPTETTVTCASFDPRGSYDVGSGRELPIGRPLANARAYILDSAGRHLMPDGAAGELWIGGTGVALGYLGQPRLTDERFRPDPFVACSDARMYRTGDKARWSSEGDLEYLGRVDRQIKLRGFRIEPAHIERRLEQLQGVSQAFVALRSGATDVDRLVGWVVPLDDRVILDTAELRELVSGLLPDYLVPSALVQVDELPRTSAGKVDLSALPDPPSTRPESSRVDRSDDGAVARLCELFEELLGGHVSRYDSFFEVGGNSLLAVRLIGLIEEQWGACLSMADLVAAQSPRELALAISSAPGGARAAYLCAIQPAGANVPLYGLHVIGENGCFYRPLSDRLGPDQPVFGLAVTRPDEFTPTDVVDIAAVYVDEIQRHRPDGPIAVAGVSLAGFVAFEVAQQLSAAGRDVVLTVLLDSAGPGGQRSVRFAARVAIHLRRLRQGRWSSFRRLASHASESARQLSWTARLRVQKLMGRPTPESLWVHRFVMANVAAVEHYRPTPSSSPLLIVHAADEEFDDPEAVRAGLGWGPYAAAGMQVVDVSGDHMSMLEEPNVGDLAEVIRRSLPSRTSR